jgi:hypothetical protein
MDIISLNLQEKVKYNLEKLNLEVLINLFLNI